MKLASHKVREILFFIISGLLTLFLSSPAWAVYPPEPQSGGRFFHAKGTKSAAEYRYLGRTGNRPEEEYQGKGFQFEMLKLKPYGSYTGEWDTNVFLAEDDRSSDYINRLNWGVDGEIPMEDGKYILSSGIHSESEWFAKHDEENHTDWIYQGGGELNFNPFSLEVFEEFRRTSSRAGSELTRRQDRKENYLTGLLTVPFGEFFQETEVSHYALMFRDPSQDLFDRDEFRAVPRIGWNFGDRTQVLTEYEFSHIHYDIVDDRKGNANQLALGLRGLLGEGDLVNYQAWAGWQVRNYNSDLRDDFSGFVFRADAEYRPSEVSRIFLETTRRPVESVTSTNSFIVRNDIAAGWRRQLAEKLEGEIRGAVGFFDYSNDRFDFFWEPAAKLDYLLPGHFAHLFTEYRFSARHSDASNQDYARHLWNFGIRLEA